MLALGLQKGRELPGCCCAGFAAFVGDFFLDLGGPQYVSNSLAQLYDDVFWRACGGQNAGPDTQFIVREANFAERGHLG